MSNARLWLCVSRLCQNTYLLYLINQPTLTTDPQTSLEHCNEQSDGAPKPSWALQPTTPNLQSPTSFKKLNEGCREQRHFTLQVQATSYILTGVTIRTPILWDVTPCSSAPIWALYTKPHEVTYRQAASFERMFLQTQVLLGWRNVIIIIFINCKWEDPVVVVISHITYICTDYEGWLL
jgi:hypothetical protein